MDLTVVQVLRRWRGGAFGRIMIQLLPFSTIRED